MAASFALPAMASLLGTVGGAPQTAATFLGMNAATLGTMATVGSMATSVIGGMEQKKAADAAADAERVAAIDRDVERRRRLVSALASQNVARASQGIRLNEGSPVAMQRADINRSRYEGLRSNANAAVRINEQKAKGQAAMTQGLLSAGNSLLDYGYRTTTRG